MIQKVFKSDIVRNSSILITGTILGQIIPIALSPILRRMYEPEVFGAFSVYLSLVGILVFIFTLRYELAIINPKKDNRAANLLFTVFLLSMIFGFVLFFIVLLLKTRIATLINFPVQYSNWLYLMPFTVTLYGIYQGIQYWLIRKKAFKPISINKISRRFAEGGAQIGIGYFKQSFGLIIGDFVGMIANVGVGFWQSIKAGFSFKQISYNRIKEVTKDYKEYPIYNALPALLNTIGLLLPIMIVNKYYGPDITGQYDLTRQVLALPIALLSVSISQVFLQRISEKKKKLQSVKKDLLSLFLFLAGISFVVTIVIFFWGEELFTFVFGDKWLPAGQFSEILIYKYAFVFMVSPISSIVFVALEKIKISSYWQSFYFLMILSLFFFVDLNIESFFRTYVVIELISYLLYLLLIIYVIVNYEKSISAKR